MEELRQVYPLCSQFGAYQDNVAPKGLQFFKDQEQLPQQQQQQQQPRLPPKANHLTLDEYFDSCFPAPAQPMQEIKRLENIARTSKETPQPFAPSSSLELLNNYGSGLKKLNLNQCGNDDETSAGSGQKLSTEEIMKVAGARYIQFSDQSSDDFPMLMHPFGYALSGLSEEETWDVELVHILLAAAEKVGYQQFDRASRLLTSCEWVASEKANPVQRVVFYFAEALRERINKAIGRFTRNESEETTKCETLNGLSVNLASLHFHQKVPFNQIMHIAAIQATVENVGSVRKLHVIDLEIRSGVLCVALMQALAQREQRPLQYLKISAVGRLTEKNRIEDTGKRLENFAESMKFGFKFKVVYVSCMNDIKEELFETAPDESVVVFSNIILRTLISRPAWLENLMRVIKNLNPSLMVVGEVQANHNSPTFVNRFVEALFFYGVYFDCLETCMDANDENRTKMEANLSHGIRQIVATEGIERIARSVKIDVWRAFFSRFRMVEIGLSESSLYQANLVAKRYPYGSSCTIEKNGKCLLIGWKGTPLHSLSAWKFSKDRLGRSFVNYNNI